MSNPSTPAAGGPEDVERIRRGLAAAGEVLKDFTPGKIAADRKAGGDPVTAADLAVDEVLRNILPSEGEGWLSEETRDSPERLGCRRVWVVDPIDGTKEFVMGIPEWCVSIGLVEDGEAVAGGIYCPAANQMVVGSLSAGVTLNGEPVTAMATTELQGATVLASRSEVKRGEWERFDDAPFTVRPMGSVAFKMGLVGAGLAPATWTLVPKNEWDVAAGTALVRAAGGQALTMDWEMPRFNQSEKTLLQGLVACGPGLADPIGKLLDLAP